MATLPVNLVIHDAFRALVVGGGAVAARKVAWLLDSGVAHVDVRAPRFCEDAVWARGGVHLERTGAPITSAMARRYDVVFAATDDPEANRRVFAAAREAGVLVNAADQPDSCTFFVPATARKGGVTVAVGTDGAAPALAAALRRAIGALLPAFWEHVPVVDRLRAARRRLLAKWPDDPDRRAHSAARLASLALAPRWDRVPVDQVARQWEQAVDRVVEEAETPVVYLVGAGPGNPGLFTLAGLRALCAADVILHDGLVPPALCRWVADRAECVDVSKRVDCKRFDQEGINAAMVRLARSGKVVCRLKGGDPFVFGRGGEEAAYLHAHGIRFEVVSGVTSPVAVTAAAGIPLTHRRMASYFQVITGHEAPEKTDSRVHWEGLARSEGTLVFLMGGRRLGEIAAKLVANGKSPDTPVAVVSRGTLPDQEVRLFALGDLAGAQGAHDFPRPTLVVVGPVVALRGTMPWWDVDGQEAGSSTTKAAPSVTAGST